MAQREVATASTCAIPQAVPSAAVMTTPPPIPNAPEAKPVAQPTGITMWALSHAAEICGVDRSGSGTKDGSGPSGPTALGRLVSPAKDGSGEASFFFPPTEHTTHAP